jgi:hypothetical protein
MPKEYFCTKLNDLEIPCGERDVSKFNEGRYSTCRSCRLKSMSEYNKTKTNKSKEQKNKLLDPDYNIRCLIEDTIKRVPISSDQTIVERIENNEFDISEMVSTNYAFTSKTSEKLETIEKQIEIMSKCIKTMASMLPEDKFEEIKKMYFLDH